MMERTFASTSRPFAAAKARAADAVRLATLLLALLGGVAPAGSRAVEMGSLPAVDDKTGVAAGPSRSGGRVSASHCWTSQQQWRPEGPHGQAIETGDNANAAGDRIYLISTRSVGTRCESAAMAKGLGCEALLRSSDGPGRWQSIDWGDLAAEFAEPLPTVVFVHGNRVETGDDKPHGLAFYRSIAACKPDDAPIRFIIWSWPSAKVPGLVKDYQVKAARTTPVGWQLAWAVDQLPAETPLALVGYSYGARIVTGALHLLAGGQLDELQLTERSHLNRGPVRAALFAAALDANWIRPGGYHGRALEQIDQLLLVNNHLDPAMRFYHLAVEGRARPLGYAGPLSVASLGEFRDRVRSVDVTSAVGRRHDLPSYLTAASRVGHVLEQVVHLPQAPTPTAGALANQ